MALYEGKFNYFGELHNFFRHASTINKAYFLMTLRLAKKLKVTHGSIKYYFGGMRDNFQIKEVIK